MELDIRLLTTFRAVADTRSFTGAAKKLRLTQSSVSQQVIALERSLGVQLLKRSNKFVGLTTAGEIFLQCARQVLDNLDRVRGLLADHYRFGTPVNRGARAILPLAAPAGPRRIPLSLSCYRPVGSYCGSGFDGGPFGSSRARSSASSVSGETAIAWYGAVGARRAGRHRRLPSSARAPRPPSCTGPKRATADRSESRQQALGCVG